MSSVAVLALAGAVVLLGQALQAANGFYSPGALLLLSLSLGLCIIGIALPEWRWMRRRGDFPALFVLGLGLALQMAQLLTTAPGLYLEVRGADFWPFLWGLAAAAVLAGGCLSEKPWLGRAQFPLLLLLHLLLGVWILRASPRPQIDVWVVLQDCARALLHGGNPYALTHADIYGAAGAAYYPAGVAAGGRIDLGLPYPPLSLLLALPGYALAGDYRYSYLAATTLSGACMAYAVGGRLGTMAAVLYLFTPRGFFVLEQGWTEPSMVLLLAALVWCALRAPRLVPAAFGLLLASKQYLALVVPAAVLLLPRPLRWPELRRLLLQAGAVALAVSLPFFLWGPAEFIRDVVTYQWHERLRFNALSYLAWLVRGGTLSEPGVWVTLAAAVPAVALALWRCPRTPAGFAAAVALVCLAFFSMGKKAFCNYYYFVLGALCLAIAASRSASMSRSGGS